MELSWLYSIPRTVFLDRFFLFFTQLPGAIGQLWLIVGIVLLFFKRTRKTGAAVLVSYIGVLLFGELLLKHVVTRMRPCQIDQTFAMLVERPTSSSFPSTHSAFAFGTAMAIFIIVNQIQHLTSAELQRLRTCKKESCHIKNMVG